MSNLKPINLAETLSLIADTWHPRAVGQFNGRDLMLVRVAGVSDCHGISEADRFFYVVKGGLEIVLPDGTVTLGAGDMHVVPRGVACQIVAQPVAEILTTGPVGTQGADKGVSAAPTEWV